MDIYCQFGLIFGGVRPWGLGVGTNALEQESWIYVDIYLVDPLPGVETKCYLVNWFSGFLVNWFAGLMVCWFTGLLVG